MQVLNHIIPRNPPSTTYAIAVCKCLRDCPVASNFKILNSRIFSSDSQNGGNEGDQWGNKTDQNFDWNDDSVSSWSTGLTKDHFDGEAVGHQLSPPTATNDSFSIPKSSPIARSDDQWVRTVKEEFAELDRENRRGKAFIDGWDDRIMETSVLWKQVREPGARGSYLKDSEKAEMYRLHKENREVYTVKRLAKDYRIMRRRVHTILWLKELEEDEEKKHGPLDDSVELLLDTCPD